MVFSFAPGSTQPSVHREQVTGPSLLSIRRAYWDLGPCARASSIHVSAQPIHIVLMRSRSICAGWRRR
jgi:hypothetical protein